MYGRRSGSGGGGDRGGGGGGGHQHHHQQQQWGPPRHHRHRQNSYHSHGVGSAEQAHAQRARHLVAAHTENKFGRSKRELQRHYVVNHYAAIATHLEVGARGRRGRG